MRSTSRAAIAVASILALVAGLFAFVASPASAGTDIGPIMFVEKTVVGEGPDDEFDLVIGCDAPDIEPQATIDVPFSLFDGQSDGFTESQLGTEFDFGVECTVGEEIPEGLAGLAILVTDEDGDLVSNVEWEASELVVGETATLTFQTTPEYTGDYFVDVFNLYTPNPDLCAIAAEYLALSDVDPMTLSPEELEAVLGDIIAVLIEADAVGVPAEYQDSLDTLIGVYFELNNILLTVDYDVELLDEEQIAEILALSEAGEAAEAELEAGLIEVCTPPTPPTPPTPGGGGQRPADAVRARPAFTG